MHAARNCAPQAAMGVELARYQLAAPLSRHQIAKPDAQIPPRLRPACPSVSGPGGEFQPNSPASQKPPASRIMRLACRDSLLSSDSKCNAARSSACLPSNPLVRENPLANITRTGIFKSGGIAGHHVPSCKAADAKSS
jgi:hypothetical protein